jgi:hypothetical protein
MDKQAATGLYGFTKDIQTCVEAASRKLTRVAAKTASNLWAKDHKSAEFLTLHARKAGSLPAKALLAAMSDLGPKVDRAAASRTHGLYGFRNKTAQRSLLACQAVREEAGYLAHDLATRKSGKYSDVLGYMEKHCETTQCVYTTLLMQAMPDDKLALLRTASEDSGAGSAGGVFFADPKRRSVRDFAWTEALTNVPAVVKRVVDQYEVLDKSNSQLKSEVNQTPNTPNETLKATPGSDQFSTLSQYIVTTVQPVKKMPGKMPDGHSDTNKAPDLSIAHALAVQNVLARRK